MSVERRWLPVALIAVLALIAAVILWKAFTGDPSPDNSRTSSADDIWDSLEPAPEFSIPKIADCTPAGAAELAQISQQLQAHTGLSTSARVVDGQDTYLAAVITYNDEPTGREPGLWVIRGGKVYAVGDTTAFSAAPPATDIAVFGDNDAAATVIGCAAGY